MWHISFNLKFFSCSLAVWAHWRSNFNPSCHSVNAMTVSKVQRSTFRPFMKQDFVEAGGQWQQSEISGKMQYLGRSAFISQTICVLSESRSDIFDIL
ncbi:hypothetical protein FB446DRAFT_749161 [Lentinula raphanica]|nr:hypothetical protein FB446DRAFT_749161 [Lentinula raphanica]